MNAHAAPAELDAQLSDAGPLQMSSHGPTAPQQQASSEAGPSKAAQTNHVAAAHAASDSAAPPATEAGPAEAGLPAAKRVRFAEPDAAEQQQQPSVQPGSTGMDVPQVHQVGVGAVCQVFKSRQRSMPCCLVQGTRTHNPTHVTALAKRSSRALQPATDQRAAGLVSWRLVISLSKGHVCRSCSWAWLNLDTALLEKIQPNS